MVGAYVSTIIYSIVHLMVLWYDAMPMVFFRNDHPKKALTFKRSQF